MSLMNWELKETPEGNIFSTDVVDGYEIIQRGGKFFVHRTLAACDDIGPLEDFKLAEDMVMEITIALVVFEEQVWRVRAALVIKAQRILDDGTASQLEDPDFDGHDCEGFEGGCARLGCLGGDDCEYAGSEEARNETVA